MEASSSTCDIRRNKPSLLQTTQGLEIVSWANLNLYPKSLPRNGSQSRWEVMKESVFGKSFLDVVVLARIEPVRGWPRKGEENILYQKMKLSRWESGGVPCAGRCTKQSGNCLIFLD